MAYFYGRFISLFTHVADYSTKAVRYTERRINFGLAGNIVREVYRFAEGETNITDTPNPTKRQRGYALAAVFRRSVYVLLVMTLA